MDNDAAAASEFPRRPVSFALSVAADPFSGAWPFPGKLLIICEPPPRRYALLRGGRTPNLWVGKSARRSGFPKLFPATTELTAPQCDDGIRAPDGPMHAGQL